MAVDFSGLWESARAAAASDEAESVRQMAEILSSKDGRTFILDLEPSDAELCIEILDHGLALHRLRSSRKQAFFTTLRRLAGKHARLPESMVFKDEIDYSASSQYNTSGGLADVKQGKCGKGTVAVKILRVTVEDDLEKIRSQFCKEVILWNSLSHPNVLKFVGVLATMEEGKFATVSEWMTHGNIMEYIRKHATNRLDLVGVSGFLLHGAAQGLSYLHDANLIHGDLKGANILMTNDTPPKACLANFEFTAMVFDPMQPMSSSLELGGGTMTFMAPEILTPSKYGLKTSVPTREGDIYAFGLVILQVLTGELPFRDVTSVQLGYLVGAGLRPPKPENAGEVGISDSLWELIQKCWDGEKTRRPQIQEVVDGVGEAAASWHELIPPSTVVHTEDSEEDESDELKNIAIFQSHRSEPLSAARTSINASTGMPPNTPTYNPNDSPISSSTRTLTNTTKSSNTYTRSTQPSEMESYEERVEPEFKHLNQNNAPPPTTLPPPKRKGIGRFLKKRFQSILGNKGKH